MCSCAVQQPLCPCFMLLCCRLWETWGVDTGFDFSSSSSSSASSSSASSSSSRASSSSPLPLSPSSLPKPPFAPPSAASSSHPAPSSASEPTSTTCAAERSPSTDANAATPMRKKARSGACVAGAAAEAAGAGDPVDDHKGPEAEQARHGGSRQRSAASSSLPASRRAPYDAEGFDRVELAALSQLQVVCLVASRACVSGRRHAQLCSLSHT